MFCHRSVEVLSKRRAYPPPPLESGKATRRQAWFCAQSEAPRRRSTAAKTKSDGGNAAMAARYLSRVTGVSAVAILAAMSGPALAQSAAELREIIRQQQRQLE